MPPLSPHLYYSYRLLCQTFSSYVVRHYFFQYHFPLYLSFWRVYLYIDTNGTIFSFLFSSPLSFTFHVPPCLLYSAALPYSTPLCSTLLYFALLYSTPLFITLLSSALIYFSSLCSTVRRWIPQRSCHRNLRSRIQW